MAGGITCDAVDNDVVGNDFQLVADNLDILILTEQLQSSFVKIPLHAGIGHQMQQVEFDAVNIIVGHAAANIFQHHLMGLPRQTIDQMGHNLRLGRQLTNPLDRFDKELVGMGSVDKLRSFFIGGLQAQLQGHMHPVSQLSDIGQGLVRQAVWAGPDVDAHYPRLIDSLLIALPQDFHPVMGIGKILKVHQVFLDFWPLAVHEVNFLVKLLPNRRIRCHDGITRTGHRTKSTAPLGHRSVPVGTVKARINGHLENLLPENLSVIII